MDLNISKNDNITMYLEINIFYQAPRGNPVRRMFIVMHLANAYSNIVISTHMLIMDLLNL